MPATPNFIPTIWDTQILRVLEDNLIAKKICNRKHEGQIKQAGDTVKFQGLSDPTINTYAGTVSYEELKDSGLVMQIDQQKYFAFKVDDIDKAQTNIDEKGSQATRAAYKLRETADTFIMNKYADANISVSGTITTANVLSKVGEVCQKLAEVNVSENDTFMVIPPWMRLKLQLAGIKFSINEGLKGTGGMAWTNELGFDMYVTNQVVNLGSAATPQSQIIAGAYNSIMYADQIINTQYFDKLEDSFDCAVRGLHVYGAKVIRPDLLVNFDATFGAETTI
jgi:hypothetical protein